MNSAIQQATTLVKRAARITAFTGAGISVESGIPSFRGEGGLWTKYDTKYLEIDYFMTHPEESWKVIKEIFYSNLLNAKPNKAHYALYELEKLGKLRSVITQNIDNLHRKAGSKTVYELHGNCSKLVCTKCDHSENYNQNEFDAKVPLCPKCKGLLKPDIVFFGEDLPEKAYNSAIREAQLADVFLIIGTSGEIMPAALIPHTAKQYGASIIEINTEETILSDSVSEITLIGKASDVLKEILSEFFK